MTSSDVFNIIQKGPNTVVHLKVDEALEGRRSQGNDEQVGGESSLYYLSGLLQTRKLLKLYRST